MINVLKIGDTRNCICQWKKRQWLKNGLAKYVKTIVISISNMLFVDEIVQKQNIFWILEYGVGKTHGSPIVNYPILPREFTEWKFKNTNIFWHCVWGVANHLSATFVNCQYYAAWPWKVQNKKHFGHIMYWVGQTHWYTR